MQNDPQAGPDSCVKGFVKKSFSAGFSEVSEARLEISTCAEDRTEGVL
jgi:hypothetical protein